MLSRRSTPCLALLVGAAMLSAQAQPAPGGPAAPRTTRTLERIDQIVNDAQGLQRALNLARATGIQLNGGLSVYQPARCMVAGISDNPCLISRSESGFVFRFRGGVPGWEQEGQPATVETELRLSRDGRSLLEVLYNGAPRPAASATSS